MECVPKELLTPQPLQRAQTEQLRSSQDDHGIAQGRIMWLPAAEELPERAVRRAHGKGAVEDGIYNHPVVVVSRPADDEQSVHFHLVSRTWSSSAFIDAYLDYLSSRKEARSALSQIERVSYQPALVVSAHLALS